MAEAEVNESKENSISENIESAETQMTLHTHTHTRGF